MSNPRKNNISDNEQLSLDFGYFDIVPPKNAPLPRLQIWNKVTNFVVGKTCLNLELASFLYDLRQEERVFSFFYPFLTYPIAPQEPRSRLR